MPYRLRLYDGDQLLVATDDESVEALGGRMAELMAELLGEEGSIRYELAEHGPDDDERAATDGETNILLRASGVRQQELGEIQMGPCPRCGRRAADHGPPLYPMRGTVSGPIYFACWTADERDELPPGFAA